MSLLMIHEAYISDPDFLQTNGLTKVFHEALADLKIKEFLKVRGSLIPFHYGPVVEKLTLTFCPDF